MEEALVRCGVLGLPPQSPANAAAPAEPEDVALVPRPWSSSSDRRLGVWLALCAWLAVTLLPVAQIALANAEQRAQALAARKAVEVSTALGANGLVRAFALNSTQRATTLSILATGTAYAAAITQDPSEALRLTRESEIEYSASVKASSIASSMTQPPSAADGVDTATLTAISASPAETQVILAAQNRQADRAELAGRRSARVALALLLAALSLSLAALAASGRASRTTVIDGAAAAVLFGALIAAASVFLIGV